MFDRILSLFSPTPHVTELPPEDARHALRAFHYVPIGHRHRFLAPCRSLATTQSPLDRAGRRAKLDVVDNIRGSTFTFRQPVAPDVSIRCNDNCSAFTDSR